MAKVPSSVLCISLWYVATVRTSSLANQLLAQLTRKSRATDHLIFSALLHDAVETHGDCDDEKIDRTDGTQADPQTVLRYC